MLLKKIIIISILGLAPLSCFADVPLIDLLNKEPANNEAGLLRPTKGQSMTQVKSHFGEPIKASLPIGNPPITRWSYPKFSVYFEHHHVIHSVVNKPPKTR